MYFRKSVLILGLCVLFATWAQTMAQSSIAQTLEPPVTGLNAIHHPDISQLEPAVMKQVSSLQEALAASAKPTTPAADLSLAYGNMARAYHAYSFLEPAKECYENAARLAPDAYQWTYMLGKVAQQQNQFSKAAEYFKKTLAMNRDYFAASINLGNVYFELDLLGESEKRFQQVLLKSENNPAAIYGLGRIELERKNFTNAEKYFTRVLELVPEANRVHYSLAMAYRGLGETEKAKIHLGKQGVVGIRPADPLFDSLDADLKGIRLRLVNGKLAFQAQRYKEAESEFRAALELEPGNISALVNLGATLTQLGQGTEAIDMFVKALSIDPANTNARYNLAYLLLLKGDYLQAVGHYKILLKQNPKDVESRYRLGLALKGADLMREAAFELVAVYNAKPDQESVALELSDALVKTGEHEKAKAILIKSYQIDSTRGRTVAALSSLLASSPDRSLREGEKALKLSQLLYKSTGLHEHRLIIALSLAELGKCEEAETTTRDIIEKAKAAGKTELASGLEKILPRLVRGEPCRP